MAQEVYLKLIVQDGDVDTTTRKLQTLGHEVDNVGKKGKTAGDSIGGGFKGAKESANNLEGGLEGISKELGTVASAAKKGGAAMKSALVSTGIGAFIVALGYVVDNWEKIAEVVGLSTKSIEEQIELLNAKQKLLNGELSNLDKQLKLLELQGKSNTEIQKQKLALIEQQRELNKAELTLLETQLTRLESTRTELSLWEQIKGAVTAVAGGSAAATTVAENIAIERQKEIDALREKINAVKGDLIGLDIAEFQTQNLGATETEAKREKFSPIDFLTAEEYDAKKQAELERFNELNEELFGIQQRSNEKLLQEAQNLDFSLSQVDAQRVSRLQQVNDFIANLANEETKVKIQAAQNILGSVSQLAEEGSGIAKGVAVAQATMSTYEAAVAAYAAGSSVGGPAGLVLGPLAAGLAVAAGIANVVKILKTKPIENKAPSAASAGGRGGAVAPSFNVVGTSGQNQIAQTLAERDEQPIQAYVVGSNVTSQQALDRNIQDTATIG